MITLPVTSAHAAKLRAIREERDPVVQAWALRALVPASNLHTTPDDAARIAFLRNLTKKGSR